MLRMQTFHGFKYVDSAESIDAAISACAQVAKVLHRGRLASPSRLDAVRRDLLDLGSRRNAFVPAISRLPAETLAEIFLAFEQQYRADSFVEDDEPQERPIGWICITHVCRRWRDVALDAPRLWRHVPMLYNSDISATFLERSKHTPLYITPGTISVGKRLQLKHSRLLASAAPRIRSLQLRCLGIRIDASSSRTWDAPLLETIDLSLWDSPASAGFAFLTCATLPKLKKLSLRYVCTDLCTPLFKSTLTRLMVDAPSSRLESVRWASLLEQIPLLGYLELRDAVKLHEPFEYIHPSPHSTKVIMAHLSSVVFSDALDCVQLLEYLALPTLQTLTVSLFDTGLPIEDAIERFRYVFSVISSALLGDIWPPSCSIRLHESATLKVDLGPARRSPGPALPTPDATYDTDPPAAPCVHLWLDCNDVLVADRHDGTDKLSDIISNLVSSPLLSNVRSLSIWNDGRRMRCPKRVSVLSPLHLVEELTYTEGYHVTLLYMLAARTPDSTLPLMFPALTTLTLRRTEWQHFNTPCVHSLLLSQDVDDMLNARKALGVPLQELYLREVQNIGPKMDDSWLKTPRSDLRVFDWDGRYTDAPDSMCFECLTDWPWPKRGRISMHVFVDREEH